jgi:hypothetical protein
MDQTPADPPFLGTWKRVYVAVLLLEAATIAGIALFTYWPY